VLLGDNNDVVAGPALQTSPFALYATFIDPVNFFTFIAGDLHHIRNSLLQL